MGHRLSKLYTRTGDDGTTGLAGNQRVAKDHPRICAIGDIDELNSSIGVLLCQSLDDALRSVLTEIQHRLFDLGGELAMPEYRVLEQAHIDALESLIDEYNAILPPLKEFILPGGEPAAAHCHLARAVCRRAERSLATLQQQENMRGEPGKYLNRLSDLLFVLARILNRSAGGQEPQWQSATKK